MIREPRYCMKRITTYKNYHIEKNDQSSEIQKTIATYEQTLKDFHLTTAENLASFIFTCS